MKRLRLLLLIALGAVGLGLSGVTAGAAGAPIPLAKVDLDRMVGGWYLIATIPNGFEKGMVTPYDFYSRRPDGDIREDFYVRHGSFHAPVRHYLLHDWILPGTGNASWRLQVLWPFKLPFLALYIDPQYRYTIFGEQDRKLGWIYSRTPKIPPADYRRLLARLATLGYDPTRFLRLVQTPDELGQPGVWTQGIRQN
jgi:apolipoprotein D and lipocalin family protein